LAEQSTKLARLDERNAALERQVGELRAQESKLQEILKTEFENIAMRVLKANASELSDTSQKQIGAILDPLRERIQEFQGKVENTYDAEKREVLSLKEQIRLIVETSKNLGLQADGLAKARKGDVQMLGRWGELVLDRILQTAGLVEGREYITQGRGLGLKSETGSLQKPDVIVLLPEKRAMVIDSKITLAAYDRLIAAKDEVDRLEQAVQFVRDVKVHIDGLAGKRYQDNEQIAAHECVLMFVPIEGALAAAITADSELFTYAWDKRVVLVGPSTLLMTLRTVASIWRYEMQAENAQQIAKLAGILCDKISAGLGDLNVVADRLNQALSAHGEAVKRLSTGRGNALSVGERIRSLGVKTKGPMPAMLVEGERIEADIELAEEPKLVCVS
jgi:DNA recombination protein RmuC